MKIYNKLVRDKIDQIINSNGKGEKAIIKILNEDEYKNELIKKLEEEKKELIEAVVSGDENSIIEESADLLEVINAINNNDLQNVFDTMKLKNEKRGGFKERKFLIRVDD